MAEHVEEAARDLAKKLKGDDKGDESGAHRAEDPQVQTTASVLPTT